ncbi:MAG: DnaJ domain-containing protein [Deltaproteobacteria bacterium]|nr:DnaJ domain-containing protein [Deltaproteobacteria bacterium]
MTPSRPKPIAKGNFANTPFAHILVYIRNKRLHGTLEVHEGGQEISIYFREGAPTRVASTEPGKRLGEVLAEMGRITPQQLQESLDEVRRTGELHGQALVRMGFVDGSGLVAGITEQMISKMTSAFGFTHGEYAFYQGVDLIPQGPSEIINMHSWALLMAGIRQYAAQMNLSPYLAALDDKSFFLADPELLKDFRLNGEERMLCRRLLERPQDLISLKKWDAVDRHVVLGTLYVLLITKTLKVIAPEEVERTESIMPKSTLDSVAPREQQTSFPPEIQEMRDRIQTRAAQISSQNYYEMLDVTRDATAADVRKAFFKLAKHFHPDRAAKAGLEDLRETLAYLFANLSEAQNTLVDEDARENYDAYLISSGGAGDVGGKTDETDEERQVRLVIEADRLYQKAHVLMRQQKNAEALEMMEEACTNCPEEGEYIATRAYLKIQLGMDETGSTLNDFRIALQKNPKSERCHFYFAQALKNNGRINEAKQHFKMAVEINPRNIEAAREIRLIEMRSRNTGKNRKPGLFGKFRK